MKLCGQNSDYAYQCINVSHVAQGFSSRHGLQHELHDRRRCQNVSIDACTLKVTDVFTLCSSQEMRSLVMTAMREGFRPEFLNRIDEFVIFDRLSAVDMRKISTLELNKVTLRLADKNITLEATDAALDFLSSVG